VSGFMSNPLQIVNYNLIYLFKVLSNILHKHHVRAVNYPDKIIKHYLHQPSEQEDWYRLFNINTEKRLPLTYYMKAGRTAFALIDFLKLYDLNIINLVHLKSSLWFKDCMNTFVLNKIYRLEYSVNDIVNINHGRICFIAKIKIYNENNVHIYEQKNCFLINKLSDNEAELFDRFPHYDKHHIDVFTKLKPKEPKLLNNPNMQIIELEIPCGLGGRFGKVSGDMNVFHTNRTIAKLHGEHDAFIQGLCIVNMILATLCKAGFEMIDKFNITFCKKIYEGQTINLLINQGNYELIDKKAVLLACGRIKQSTANL
jgi:hypothetical protein